jgi:aminopeptidase N
MEYPMATLLYGPSLGTVFHEWMHSWYQMLLATNESLYAWMDEGFTSFAEDLVSANHNQRNSLTEFKDALAANPKNEELKKLIGMLPNDHAGAYVSYFNLVKSGLEEPMSTHADHYNTNYAYSLDAYSKGEVFLSQLGYIIGDSARDKTLLDYYNTWKYKHPNPNDFIRIAEKNSGMQLDWYKQYWINSTKTIDYAIDSLWEEDGVSKIRIKRIGLMPMPVDLKLSFKNKTTELHHIPLNLMFEAKKDERLFDQYVIESEWRWTHPTYIITLKQKLTDLTAVEIDPTKRMADTDRRNNLLELNW